MAKSTITRVYAPDVAPDQTRIELSVDEAHHLVHVVRARIDDAVRVFDGHGREWTGRVAEISKRGAVVDLASVVPSLAEPAVRVTLAIGLLKGDQMDVVVRDATVMGAVGVIPLDADHVAVSTRARDTTTAIDRWRRVAVAAAKQCGRSVLPALEGTATLEEVLKRLADATVLVCLEPSAAGAWRERHRWKDLPVPATAVLLVGPEGGWSAAELRMLGEHGAHALDLGPRTLRAECAPIVALATLWSVWR